MKKLIQTILALFISILSLNAFAGDIHPPSNLVLGGGYDPLAPWVDKSKSGFFEWSSEKNSRNKGVSIEYSVIEANNQKKYYRALSVDLATSAKWGLGSGSFSLASDASTEIDERSLVYVLQGKIKYNPERKDGNVVLSDAGKKRLESLRNSGSIAGFYKAGGTQIITSIQKGAEINLVYHYHASSVSKRNELRSSLAAKHTSWSLSANLNEVVRSIDAGATLTINAYQNGVDIGNTNILDIISQEPGNLPELRKIIGASLKNTSYKNASIISHTALDVEAQFGLDNYRVDFLEARINRKLEDIFVAYNQAYYRKGFINKAQVELKESDYTPNGQDDLRIKEENYEKNLLKLEDLGIKLLSAKKISDAKVDIPEIPKVKIGDVLNDEWAKFDGWKSKFSASQVWNKYHWNIGASYAPKILFSKLLAIESAQLYHNGQPVRFLSKPEIVSIHLAGGDFSKIWKYTTPPMQIWIWEGTPYNDALANATNQAKSYGKVKHGKTPYRLIINDVDGETHEISWEG